MKLRYRIVCMLVATAVILTVIGNWIFEIFFTDYVKDQENKQINIDVNSAYSYLLEKQQKYKSIANDWGHWDESFNYINTHDEEFVRLNLSESSLNILNVNLMIFYNKDKAVVKKVNYNMEKKLFVPFSPKILNKITQMVNSKSKDDVTTIIGYENEYYIIAISEVTDSLLEKPSNGVLVVGRLIDLAMVSELNKITEGNIALYPINGISKDILEGLYVKPINQNIVHVLNIDALKNTLSTYLLAPASDNEKASVVLNITKTRDIYKSGMAQLLILQGSYTAFIIICLILLFWFISVYISKPILSLTNSLNNIDLTREKFVKLPVNKKNEISQISSTINNMLVKIETERDNLKTSEKRSNLAQTIAHVGNWELDLKTLKVWASDEAFRIYGINRVTDELPLELVQKCVFPEYRQMLDIALEQLITKQAEYAIEFKIHKADSNEERYIYSRAELVQAENGEGLKVLGTIQDITDRKVIQEALLKSYAAQKAMIANISDVIGIMNPAGIITYQSPNIQKIFGWYPEDIVGESGLKTVHPEDADFMRKQFYELLEVDSCVKTVEYRYQCKDGSYAIIELTATNLIHDPNIEGILFNYHDITQRKKNDEEILYASYHDSLTGLNNRRFFEEAMLKLDCQEQLPLSIIISDINGLKLINDIYGHIEGDSFIVMAAENIKKVCRRSDIVARWGGDEIIILLPKTSEEEVQAICKRIDNNLIKDNARRASLSVGYATKHDMKDDINEVLKVAEDFMYKRKLLQTKSLRSSIVSSIISTLHERYIETKEHSDRMKKLCRATGAFMGISDALLDDLELLALLHDIGKIAIKDTILNKAGKLTAEEWEEMKRHCEIGYHITQSTSEFGHLSDYILSHHEHWDGSGYPRALKGEKIPVLARIIAVVDAYDAMRNDRPYRKAVSKEEAIKELKTNAGTQFDSNIVNIFVNKVIKND